MRYPRIDTIRRTSYTNRAAMQNYMRTGIGMAISYEIQVKRPNRPLESHSNLSDYQCRYYIRKAMERLKKEGYDKAVIEGRMTNL